MEYRTATKSDLAILAAMNWQLIRDEGHQNPMSPAELERRMAGWLDGEYQALLFEDSGHAVGYALFRHDAEYVYLRQFFVRPEFRRRGIGRAALDWLRSTLWTGSRVRVEVLIGNTVGIAFWRSLGFQDYCLTMELEHVCN
jgi:GNAT superfamily N-acetyltransferase